MTRNYFKTTFRKLLKFKTYSLINVTGLTVNMTFSILIVLFVWNEFSYDRYHEHVDRIFRITTSWEISDNTLRSAVVPQKLAPILNNNLPSIVSAARITPSPQKLSIEYDDKQYYEKDIMFADAAIFDVFTFPPSGEPATALVEPSSLVITEETAQRYFGEENPIGKTLTVADKYEMQVTGVLKDIPVNSHFHFDFLVPLGMLERLQDGGALSTRVLDYTYVLVAPDYNHSELEKQLAVIEKRYAIGPASGKYRMHLQPLTDIHLHSNLRNELEPGFNIRYLQILLLVAVLIMVTAAINYTNMALAYSASRTKEIGVRKVVGANKKQLMGQFLVEPVLINLMALLLAFGLVEIFLPAVSTLIGKQLAITHWQNSTMLLVFIAAAVFTGLLSGCYPSFVLSSFKPVNVLKGKILPGVTGVRTKETLVVFQFAASIAMIVCTIVILNQLKYIQNKDLGLDTEHIIVIPVENTLVKGKIPEFKIELLRQANIVSVAASSCTPGRGKLWEVSGTFKPGSPMTTMPLRILDVDHDYTTTYNMKIVEGRSFSRDFPGDEFDGTILNKSAVKVLGLKSPLGSQTNVMMRDRTIIGIVDDFHVTSLHKTIEPVALVIALFSDKYVSVKIRPENISATLKSIEQTWSQFTAEPFEYSFVESDLNALYNMEQQLSQVFSSLALVVIITSCLGLFGLAAFISEQRSKEIAIRKVMGASVSRIVFLLSKNFALLVVIAGIISSPIAYWAMRNWLDSFAYRVEIEGWIFGLAVSLAFTIALLTVSLKTLRVAKADPVKSLRYE